jgi:hypothetical protein
MKKGATAVQRIVSSLERNAKSAIMQIKPETVEPTAAPMDDTRMHTSPTMPNIL